MIKRDIAKASLADETAGSREPSAAAGPYRTKAPTGRCAGLDFNPAWRMTDFTVRTWTPALSSPFIVSSLGFDRLLETLEVPGILAQKEYEAPDESRGDEGNQCHDTPVDICQRSGIHRFLPRIEHAIMPPAARRMRVGERVRRCASRGR